LAGAARDSVTLTILSLDTASARAALLTMLQPAPADRREGRTPVRATRIALLASLVVAIGTASVSCTNDRIRGSGTSSPGTSPCRR
jgi:hypothetical protein